MTFNTVSVLAVLALGSSNRSGSSSGIAGFHLHERQQQFYLSSLPISRSSWPVPTRFVLAKQTNRRIMPNAIATFNARPWVRSGIT